MTAQVQVRWTSVCRYDDLIPERGVAALVEGVAVAVFRTHDGALHALSNLDPFSRASVLSRGIVGDRQGRATVASPIYKQVFELATGMCLDDPAVSVPTYPVRVIGGIVEVGSLMTAPSISPMLEPLPLAGFTVGVTAARRAAELGALLERRGAEVLHAPAIRIVPLADDTELHAATEQLINYPPDVVVVTTGIGFRGWVEAADGWGLGEALIGALRGASLLSRGPKARGAVRAAGLTDAWSPPSESSAEVLEHLLTGDVEGMRVAVQLHGEPLPDFVDALNCAGAQVVQVPVYRWVLPADLAPLDRLIGLVLDGGVDAISFTSAPAAASVLRRADELGALEPLLRRLRREVLAACVGPVTAGPLVAREVPTVQPQRSRIGALVRTLSEALPARAPRWPVAGHVLELRGHAAVVDGALRAVPPTPMALLRLLAARPGRVVPRTELLSVMPAAGDDEHAVETAVARLRAALGAPRLVQTVVKRGYRLALEPGDCR